MELHYKIKHMPNLILYYTQKHDCSHMDALTQPKTFQLKNPLKLLKIFQQLPSTLL